MIQGTFPAMGTTIEVVAPGQDHIDATRTLFEELEQRLSRFLPWSELSAINRSLRETITVSRTMAAVLESASALRDRTAGLVDPAVGAAVRAWGYDRTFSAIRDLPETPPASFVPDWGIDGRYLWRQPGTMLDLGGIAKGWAADRAVESGRALVVSAGGDVRSALEDARVDVRDPWDHTPAMIELGRGALATSSVMRRRWRAGSEEANHLIDPRTGAPAEGTILSATAMCATAAESEAAAKAVLLQGVDGLAWASDRSWIAAAMAVWHDGSVYATTGWKVAA